MAHEQEHLTLAQRQAQVQELVARALETELPFDKLTALEAAIEVDQATEESRARRLGKQALRSLTKASRNVRGSRSFGPGEIAQQDPYLGWVSPSLVRALGAVDAVYGESLPAITITQPYGILAYKEAALNIDPSLDADQVAHVAQLAAEGESSVMSVRWTAAALRRLDLAHGLLYDPHYNQHSPREPDRHDDTPALFGRLN